MIVLVMLIKMILDIFARDELMIILYRVIRNYQIHILLQTDFYNIQCIVKISNMQYRIYCIVAKKLQNLILNKFYTCSSLFCMY